MPIESMMPSNHLILCHPLLLPPSIFPSIRVFANESVLHIRWPKYWSFSFSMSPSNEYSGLNSFSTDWLDLLAVQWTLKSLLQHHSSKASILWCSAFFFFLMYFIFFLFFIFFPFYFLFIFFNLYFFISWRLITLAFFIVQHSHPYMTTRKTIALIG